MNQEPLDLFYLRHDASINDCMMALKQIILSVDPAVTHELKFGMPFFCYRGKMFCYLWVDKKLNLPYLGMVEGKHLDHPALIQEERSRMKIMRFDPNKDIPIKTVLTILKKALNLYKTGTIKIKSKLHRP